MTVEEQAEFDKIKKEAEDAKKERETVASALEKEKATINDLRGEIEKITKERDDANTLLREQDTTPHDEDVLEFDVIFNNAKKGDK